MSKTYLVAAILVLLVLAGGYLGRHTIKAALGMATPTTAVIQVFPTITSEPANPSVTTTDNIYMTKTDQTKGDYITDFAGMTLYVFDKDSTGVSNCNDKCAQLWPPYTSGAASESALPVSITVIKRADSSSQFAWNGMPLYYYSGDKISGDLTGDGFGGLWHIVKP